MTMYEKFQKLLDERNITPYKVHKDTGISTATLSDWKNGKSEPKRDKIVKICKYFDIPVSYFYDTDMNFANAGKVLEQLLLDNNVSLNRLSNDLGISAGILIKWKSGTYTPRIDLLMIVANYFGVSIDYLLTGEKKEKQHNPGNTISFSNDITDEIKYLLSTLGNANNNPITYNGKKLSPESADLFKDELSLALRRLELYNSLLTNMKK